MNVTLKMDSEDKILLKRGLQDNGPAQRFFTHEVRRISDPYVPMRTGTMKNTAVDGVKSITYPQVYSRNQWESNRGRGLRGKYWVNRAWADHGKEVVGSVAKFVGGIPK